MAFNSSIEAQACRVIEHENEGRDLGLRLALNFGKVAYTYIKVGDAFDSCSNLPLSTQSFLSKRYPNFAIQYTKHSKHQRIVPKHEWSLR